MTEQCWDMDTVSPVPEASRCCLPAPADSSSGISCTHFESCRFATFAQTLPQLYSHGSMLTLHPHVNPKFRAKIWTRASEFASIKHKLNAPSLSSQHTRPSIKSTLYFCSSGTAGRIHCPTFVANASLANKLQKDSRGTRYRTWRSWEDHAKHRRYSGASKRIMKNIIF